MEVHLEERKWKSHFAAAARRNVVARSAEEECSTMLWIVGWSWMLFCMWELKIVEWNENCSIVVYPSHSIHPSNHPYETKERTIADERWKSLSTPSSCCFFMCLTLWWWIISNSNIHSNMHEMSKREDDEMRNQDTDATTKEWKLNRNFFFSPCDRVQGQKRRGGERIKTHK